MFSKYLIALMRAQIGVACAMLVLGFAAGAYTLPAVPIAAALFALAAALATASTYGAWRGSKDVFAGSGTEFLMCSLGLTTLYALVNLQLFLTVHSITATPGTASYSLMDALVASTFVLPALIGTQHLAENDLLNGFSARST